MKLLALDTATEHCSVAVWSGGVRATREAAGTQSASAVVLEMIAACLAEAGLELQALDAIAFGRGPGGFTGLRLAASVAQGLAYGAGLPVLPVSTLRAVAQHVAEREPAAQRVLVCQDARMGEVYWAPFTLRAGFAEAAGEEAVGVPAQVRLPAGWVAADTLGAGSGFDAHAVLGELARVLPACRSRATCIAALAAHDGLAHAVKPERALPVYLRNDVAVPG